MNYSEENRNGRRDKKRRAAKYNPVRHNGVKGFSKYEWFHRNRKKGHKHMTKTFKIAMTVVSVLVMVFVLTACGGGFTGNPAIFN